MQNINRTFTVVEIGKSVFAKDIELLTSDIVEVVDLVTNAVLFVKAAEVSIYRHTLHWHGKIFRIMNIRESV